MFRSQYMHHLPYLCNIEIDEGFHRPKVLKFARCLFELPSPIAEKGLELVKTNPPALDGTSGSIGRATLSVVRTVDKLVDSDHIARLKLTHEATRCLAG